MFYRYFCKDGTFETQWQSFISNCCFHLWVLASVGENFLELYPAKLTSFAQIHIWLGWMKVANKFSLRPWCEGYQPVNAFPPWQSYRSPLGPGSQVDGGESWPWPRVLTDFKICFSHPQTNTNLNSLEQGKPPPGKRNTNSLFVALVFLQLTREWVCSSFSQSQTVIWLPFCDTALIVD